MQPELETTPADAWAAWWREQSGRFLLFARQQCRTEEDARDVLQETMVRLWKWRGGSAEVPPAGLVYATIRRAAIDHGRTIDSRSQREQRYDVETRGSDFWLDRTIEQRELATEVEAALRTLSPKLRDAIVLKVWGGLTFAEIAQALDVPPATAASRVRLALEELREKLTNALKT